MNSFYYIGNQPFGYNSLAHFGILGQKWGVRRFQYQDGSLTPEGKLRYGQVEKRPHARRAEIALNSLDRQRAYNLGDLQKAQKRQKTLNKKLSKSSVGSSRYQKLSEKAKRNQNEILNLESKDFRIKQSINDWLDEAEANDYGIKTSRKFRDTTRIGEQFIKSLPAAAMAVTMGFVNPLGFGVGVGLPYSGPTEGTKYKIKDSKLSKEQEKKYNRQVSDSYSAFIQDGHKGKSIKDSTAYKFEELFKEINPHTKTSEAAFMNRAYDVIDNLPMSEQQAAKAYIFNMLAPDDY